MTAIGTQPGPRHEERHRMSEGRTARAIEKQTARLPSDVWLWAAFGSIAGSLVLRALDNRDASHFVAHWAPTFLLLGLYNKVVKVAGSDRIEEGLETRH